MWQRKQPVGSRFAAGRVELAQRTEIEEQCLGHVRDGGQHLDELGRRRLVLVEGHQHLPAQKRRGCRRGKGGFESIERLLRGQEASACKCRDRRKVVGFREPRLAREQRRQRVGVRLHAGRATIGDKWQIIDGLPGPRRQRNVGKPKARQREMEIGVHGIVRTNCPVLLRQSKYLAGLVRHDVRIPDDPAPARAASLVDQLQHQHVASRRRRRQSGPSERSPVPLVAKADLTDPDCEKRQDVETAVWRMSCLNERQGFAETRVAAGADQGFHVATTIGSDGLDARAAACAGGCAEAGEPEREGASPHGSHLDPPRRTSGRATRFGTPHVCATLPTGLSLSLGILLIS